MDQKATAYNKEACIRCSKKQGKVIEKGIIEITVPLSDAKALPGATYSCVRIFVVELFRFVGINSNKNIPMWHIWIVVICNLHVTYISWELGEKKYQRNCEFHQWKNMFLH